MPTSDQKRQFKSDSSPNLGLSRFNRLNLANTVLHFSVSYCYQNSKIPILRYTDSLKDDLFNLSILK